MSMDLEEIVFRRLAADDFCFVRDREHGRRGTARGAGAPVAVALALRGA